MYSGNSIIKNDFLAFQPAIAFTSKAPKKIKTIPERYITVLTQPAPSKNAPAKSAITGIFAPHGINGASIAVARRSLSFLIVRLAIIPGTAQPIVITKGITDFPERPTFLKIGSKTTATRLMYPQSSRRAIKKYITITSGRNPTTATTPPITPSTSKADKSGFASSKNPPTQPWKVSNQPTSKSAIGVPTQTCEIWKTRNITTAKIGIPSHLFVKTASILSPMFLSFVRILRLSTSATILFTNSNLFLSAASTTALSVKSISP